MKHAFALLLCASLAACGGASKPTPAEPASNTDPAPAAAEPARQDEPLEAREGAEADAERARAQYEAAVRDQEEAVARIQALEKATEDMIARLNEAIAQIERAQDDADRAAAKAKLQALQREQAEMQARINAAREAAEKAERRKGQKITKECIDNPLKEGCPR